MDRPGYGREVGGQYCGCSGCSARAHASIDDRIFEVASRVLREAASAPITEINGLTVSRGLNVAHGLNRVLPFQAAEALTIPVGGFSFFVLLLGTDITRHIAFTLACDRFRPLGRHPLP